MDRQEFLQRMKNLDWSSEWEAVVKFTKRFAFYLCTHHSTIRRFLLHSVLGQFLCFVWLERERERERERAGRMGNVKDRMNYIESVWFTSLS